MHLPALITDLAIILLTAGVVTVLFKKIKQPLVLGYIVAGLGIFLFGIFELGKGLKKVAGNKIKQGLDKFASNPIKAAAIGAFVTIFLHSAGTTTLTIGLIQAGLIYTSTASIISISAAAPYTAYNSTFSYPL